jgi:Xaa-Pro dipeptidase
MNSYVRHVGELGARWTRALAAARLDAAVVAAGVSRPYFLDDQSPPFRANPHFAQWVQGELPGSHLLVVPGETPRLYVVSQEDYWHQPPVLPDVAGALDVRSFPTQHALLDALQRDVLQRNRVAFVGETDGVGSNQPFGEPNPPLLMNALHYGRAIKTDYELECMRLATRIGVAGHRAAAAAFADGACELDIHLAYLAAARVVEAELPYANIVALNEHAGVLHYQHRDRHPPRTRHSFLIDAGARCRGYSCDITRTYAAEPDSEFATLVTRLDQSQRALIDSIRPGVSFVTLHERMHQALGGILAEQGLVRCSGEAAFALGLTDAFLPHGLGHLIGLQTHDVAGHMVSPEGGSRPPPERYPALRLTRTLEEGFVFTIEPGIYFIPMLLRELRAAPAGAQVAWDRVERLVPCGGIRIEDNVHVTATGVENLTRDAFAAANA